MIDLCESRADCMAIVDPPSGLTVQQVVDWHNGQLTGHDDYLTAAPNSSYAALYWSYVQVYDSYNDQYVWIAPSGPAARTWAYNDSVSEPWFAPAGLIRGNRPGWLDLEHSPSMGERDYMYGYTGHNVNPFVNFFRDGITVWGQKTLQRAPTALDRINVRRMLLYARKVIATAVRYLVFEPNDSITWLRFRMLVEPFLRNIATRRGIFDFRVVCDATTNTPYYIDQNVMRGKLLIKPTKAAEIIEIEFTLLPTGAEFDEF
jgi:phage tail sheath protein FI